FLAAALLAAWRVRPPPPAREFSPRAIALALFAAIATAALFYSSFLTHVAGLDDALAVYGLGATRLAGGASGHEKPWWYYAWLFGWHRAGGLVWQQLLFSLLALAGLVV